MHRQQKQEEKESVSVRALTGIHGGHTELHGRALRSKHTANLGITPTQRRTRRGGGTIHRDFREYQSLAVRQVQRPESLQHVEATQETGLTSGHREGGATGATPTWS